MMYVRFPLSLCNVEDLLHERGVDVSHETVQFWWNRFRPLLASEVRKRTLQKFASAHASILNHFNQQRSLSSRATFKMNRAAAFVEWRQLYAS